MSAKVEKKDDGTLHVEYETGEVFDGDPLEITQKIAAAHQETKKWAQGIKTENENLKKAPPNPTPPPVVIPPTEETQLRSYLANQTAQFLGLKDGDELKKKLEWLDKATVEANNRGKVASFYAECPEFPNSQDNIDKLSKRMAEMGFPDENSWTPVALRAAHRDCVADGLYKPLSNEEWANNMTTASRTSAPPMIRSNSPEQTAPVDLWNEPLDKQRERIIREQLAQQGR